MALPIGCVSQDWLAYAALIRQAATESLLPLANPFTTTPQDGRYLLLFHSALGAVCRLTGISSFTALELARPPLLAALLVATWRLAGSVLHDRRHREAACSCFSGRYDSVAILAYSILPDVARRDLASVLGWSTFGASFNPLWIAGLAITLTVLRWAWTAPCRPPWDTTARVSLGLIAVGLVHSYSAIVLVASLLLWPVLGATFGLPFQPAALTALPGLAGLTAIQAWQSSDAVYASNAAEALGPRLVSPFWYPVTLGLLLPLALRGWSRWIAERHPMRLPMAAWTLAVMALHSSPLLNRYRLHLHVPVCLAAAPELVRLFERLASRPMMRLLVMMAIVPAPLFITLRCLVAIDSYRVPPSRIEALDAIATLPVGNVLADAELSNMIPALGHIACMPANGS